jgi:hypothetical protein
MGRPEELNGRPGGGGIGRPVALSGGRVDAPPSPSPPAPRWVGRIVVGPSGEAARVGAGLGTAARLRTTLGASGAGSVTVVGSGEGALGIAVLAGALTRGARGAAGVLVDSGATTGASLATGLVGAVSLTALTALVALVASSGWTSRRRPSASARRRMRSAWASSIEAEGLEAPMPSFWASPSNSLLVIPSSLESSCTRIFFCAKTFP